MLYLMMSVVMLYVLFDLMLCNYAECHKAECHYVKCRGAQMKADLLPTSAASWHHFYWLSFLAFRRLQFEWNWLQQEKAEIYF